MTKNRIADNKTALITGASSGIGEELAKCFAKAGFDLVLVARSKEKLAKLAQLLSTQHGIKAWVVADLAKPDGPTQLFKTLHNDRRTIDVLVNCAGVLEHGRFTNMPATRHQNMIDLNISALTAMLALFVPPMVERGFGRVLNVASIAAFQPIPSLATYAATKAYVLSLTESLSEELKDTGVTVTALCPGITATHMMAAAQQSSPGLQVPGFLVGDATQVAAEGFNACMRGEVIKVPGAINLATTLASRAAPKWLLRRISGAFGRSTAKK
jgi:short-subunit dehydrogenase